MTAFRSDATPTPVLHSQKVAQCGASDGAFTGGWLKCAPQLGSYGQVSSPSTTVDRLGLPVSCKLCPDHLPGIEVASEWSS